MKPREKHDILNTQTVQGQKFLVPLESTRGPKTFDMEVEPEIELRAEHAT